MNNVGYVVFMLFIFILFGSGDKVGKAAGQVVLGFNSVVAAQSSCQSANPASREPSQ